MKTFSPFAVALLVFQSTQAAVQTLPFVDHFTYSEGNLYTVGAGVWDAGGNTGPELVVTNPAALTAPTYFAAASGNGVKWTPSGTARRSIVQFGAVSSGTLYASFLINPLSVSNTKLFAYFDNSTSQPSSPQLGFFVGNGSVGIAKKGSTPVASVSVGSGTHLVVVRYTFTGTSSDQVDLWVDPASSTYGAATAPASSGSASGGSNPSSIPYFGLYTSSDHAGNPYLYVDEVRIGTSWADVTPGTPPPPPPSGLLQVTNVGMTGHGFVMRGSGGTSNGVYDVLASEDMTIPIAEWNTIGTHNFNASGNFNVTNPVPEGTDNEYFVVRVSSSSTNTPPSITSQPADQMVLVGQNATFNVTAIGSVPLNYQWYFNTNTALSAGTNATLTVSNVQSNDAGAYSVVVTNYAGSVTSLVAWLSIGEPITNGSFYVSPTGNDTNDGSFYHPFYNLQKAVSLAQPSNTIYVRGGTFPYVNTIRITNSGTALAPINLLAYPGEHPVLDFSSQPYGSANRGVLITTNGNWWMFKGLEICHAGDNGVKVEGSHLRFDQCVFHHNGDTGLQIGFGHTDSNPDGQLAAFIEVVNCDSYMNYDSDNRGSDADGFAAKMHCGRGIVFTGCRSWENSDDAWDLFETDYSIVISNCWAWHSGDAALYPVTGGSFQGNGNGFKLGGNGTGGSSMGTHYAYNCVSFNHSYKGTGEGFTQNSHKDGEVIVNCLAFSNGASGYNYFFEGGVNSGKSNAFTNNASIPKAGGGGSFSYDPPILEANNSWNLAVTVSAADYSDLSEAAAKAPRQPDGSLPAGFARLVAGSDLIDKGVDVGVPYCGTAPDLGAFEYCSP
jgi:hypothetical protein